MAQAKCQRHRLRSAERENRPATRHHRLHILRKDETGLSSPPQERPQCCHKPADHHALQQSNTRSAESLDNANRHLSDDSVLTEICVKEQSLRQPSNTMYLRLLSRRPKAAEAALFVELLQDGYDNRIIADAVIPGDHGGARMTAVS